MTTMNREQFKRTQSLIGEEAVSKLIDSRIIVFGVGGVGSYVCEALARAGVGYMEIVDKDEVDVTNINRQLIALHSTIGMPKVAVCKDRLLDINPQMEVVAKQCFYLPERSEEFDFENFVYCTEMNNSHSKRTSDADKSTIDWRKKLFFKDPYFKDFSVIVLACSNYISGPEIEEIFDVTFTSK